MTTASTFHHFDVVPLMNHKHLLNAVVLRKDQQVISTEITVKWLCLLVHMIIYHYRSFVPGLGKSLLEKSDLEDSRYEMTKEQP